LRKSGETERRQMTGSRTIAMSKKREPRIERQARHPSKP
jgi:hypothetical protein